MLPIHLKNKQTLSKTALVMLTLELNAWGYFKVPVIMLCISIGTWNCLNWKLALFFQKFFPGHSCHCAACRIGSTMTFSSLIHDNIVLWTFHKYRHLPIHYSLLFLPQVINAHSERELLSHCWCTEFLSNCLSY